MSDPRTTPAPSPIVGSGRLPRGLVGLALALVAGLLGWQLLGSPLAAAGAFVAGGVIALLGWGPLVLRPAGASLGGAAAVGTLSLVAAYVAAGLLLGGGGGVIADHQSLVLLIFSFWIVAPVMIAAAVGLALLDRHLSARG